MFCAPKQIHIREFTGRGARIRRIMQRAERTLEDLRGGGELH